MKKMVMAGALIGCLALTGCSQPPVVEHHHTTPHAAPHATPTPEIGGDGEFYSLVDEKPQFVGLEKETSEFAQTFCAVLDSGTSYRDAFLSGLSEATKQGMDAEDYGYIVGAGVASYCPVHMAEMQEFVKENTGG